MTGTSISKIKESLTHNKYIQTCNLRDIDALQDMEKLIRLLSERGAVIELYEDDRLVSIEFLENIIESHFDTEKYLQAVDDKILGD